MIPARLARWFSKAGPPLGSIIANSAAFVLLFLFGFPQFVPDTTDTIQVTVSEFFAQSPAPEKPSGGSEGSEALSRLLSNYTVGSAHAPAESAEAIAAITSANSATPDLGLQKLTSPQIDQGKIARAMAVSQRNTQERGSLAGARSGGAGFGSGLGGTVGRIGNLEIRTKKLAVIVDTSPSMFENESVIGQARTEAATLCRDTRGKLVEQDGSAVNQKFVDTVFDLAKRRPDAIYWLCDLEDGENPEQRERLRDILKKEKIRLYICTWKHHPTAALRSIIEESGGALDTKGLAADTKWATTAPTVTVCLTSGQVVAGKLTRFGYRGWSETITLLSPTSSQEVVITASDAESESWANAVSLVSEWLANSCLCPSDFMQ